MIDFNDKRQVAKAIQYTNVNPNLTRDGMLKHLETCMKYDFQAAMVAPCYIELAKDVLKGTGIQVASTLNFPIANDTLPMKIAALKEMIKTGVDQFDFPPNPGLLLGGEEKAYFEEMRQIVEVAHASGVIVKAMLEFGYITTPELKKKAAQLACEAGIDWVKTSTGQYGGPSVQDVMLMVDAVKGTKTKVKVAGVKDPRPQNAFCFIQAGAELIGTRAVVEILDAVDDLRKIGLIPAYTGDK